MALVGSEKSYTKIFFVLSQLFMLLAVWSLIDEGIIRRPWRDYQAEFIRLERQVAEQAFKKANEEYKTAGGDAKLVELSRALEKAQTDKTEDEYLQLTASLKGKQTILDDKILDVKFKKSILDNYYYEYKHAMQHGEEFAAKKKRYEDLDAEILRLSAANVNEAKGLKLEQDKLAAYDEKIANLDKQIADLLKGSKDAQDKIDAIDLRTYDIAQVVVSDYGIEGNIYWGRVDRCQTCHVAVDKSGYEDVATAFNLQVLPDEIAVADAIKKDPTLRGRVIPEKSKTIDGTFGQVKDKRFYQVMYGTHPRRQELFGKHPVEQFGCTTCHGGDGRGLRIQDDGEHHKRGFAFGHIDKAHATHHHGIEPLLRGKQMESNCLSCHNGEIFINGAQSLSKGARLFVELGCQGCHLVKGYDGLHKIGPELNKVGAKVDAVWLVDWLKNPHNYMPNTRMPNFDLSDDDIVSVASFLTANTQAHKLAAQMTLKGNAENGKKVFDTVGCRGCHATEMNEATMASRGRGPNLSRVAAKVSASSWIYDWIKNPKNYSEHARMPSLRLSDSEAADITSYLATMSPDYKNEIQTRSSGLAAKVDGTNQDLIRQGKKVMTERGCYACHLVNGFEGMDRIGPELTAEAVKEPTVFDFGDAMKHDFVFTDVEGKKVLVGHHEEEPGQETASIHASIQKPEGIDAVTNLEETWQSWVRNKIKYPLSIYKHERAVLKMPQFNIRDDEADALLAFIKGLQGRIIPDKYNDSLNEFKKKEIAGERLASQYNCMGCHAVGDFGGDINNYIEANHDYAGSKSRYYPPELTRVGEKVRPEWLHEFLKSPWKYRPAAFVRMPTFGFDGAQLNTLTDYFAGMSHVQTGISDLGYHLDNDLAKIGQTLTGKDIYNCFSCHLLNGAVPGEDSAVYAPDFATIRPRLQLDFIPNWIKGPVNYQKFVVMPAFLASKDEAFPDFFGGDPQKQLEALRAYILSVGTDEIIRKDDKHIGSADGGH
jgi:mono/diheme cytochrome c family protein